MNDIEIALEDLDTLVEIARQHTGIASWLGLVQSALIMKEALEKQLNGGWIPVSERLPNEEECNKFDVTHPNARKFLCTIKVANYEPQVRTIYFSEIVGWKYSAQDYNEYVIAWQPLPPAYKEVEDD